MNFAEELDWEGLWLNTGKELTDEDCDFASDAAIDYAASKSGSTDGDLPENQQRAIYWEMGWRLGRCGATDTVAVLSIRVADIMVWADDDYVLDGIQRDAVVDGCKAAHTN